MAVARFCFALLLVFHVRGAIAERPSQADMERVMHQHPNPSGYEPEDWMDYPPETAGEIENKMYQKWSLCNIDLEKLVVGNVRSNVKESDAFPAEAAPTSIPI